MTKEDRYDAMTDSDKKRAFRRMACNMAAMVDWPHEEKMIRASGACICDKCGLEYIDHPEENGLHLTCEGMLVKL